MIFTGGFYGDKVCALCVGDVPACGEAWLAGQKWFLCGDCVVEGRVVSGRIDEAVEGFACWLGAGE